MRNGYITDTLTSVDLCENVKLGGKVIRIYDGVVYRRNFEKSPFKKVIGKLIAKNYYGKLKTNIERRRKRFDASFG